ncbi:hypothetical protein T492DRAFT_1036366 [Pavlovales sp. CCMP2436]|nr:hypothetical protein T492DRAFT_1036366 [Pavlovales sp. CCMP2436]
MPELQQAVSAWVERRCALRDGSAPPPQLPAQFTFRPLTNEPPRPSAKLHRALVLAEAAGERGNVAAAREHHSSAGADAAGGESVVERLARWRRRLDVQLVEVRERAVAERAAAEGALRFEPDALSASHSRARAQLRRAPAHVTRRAGAHGGGAAGRAEGQGTHEECGGATPVAPSPASACCGCGASPASAALREALSANRLEPALDSWSRLPARRATHARAAAASAADSFAAGRALEVTPAWEDRFGVSHWAYAALGDPLHAPPLCVERGSCVQPVRPAAHAHSPAGYAPPPPSPLPTPATHEPGLGLRPGSGLGSPPFASHRAAEPPTHSSDCGHATAMADALLGDFDGLGVAACSVGPQSGAEATPQPPSALRQWQTADAVAWDAKPLPSLSGLVLGGQGAGAASAVGALDPFEWSAHSSSAPCPARHLAPALRRDRAARQADGNLRR